MTRHFRLLALAVLAWMVSGCIIDPATGERSLGQVITRETIAFMRKLDVKEIHGFNAARGFELLKPEALAAKRGAGGRR